MDICKHIKPDTNFEKSVLTIGSFDGMHCGHKEVIKELKLIANKKEYPSIIITFDPHPQSILQCQEEEWKVLMSADAKLNLYKEYGIDYVWIVPFDNHFAQITAKYFLNNYITKYLGH